MLRTETSGKDFIQSPFSVKSLLKDWILNSGSDYTPVRQRGDDLNNDTASKFRQARVVCNVMNCKFNVDKYWKTSYDFRHLSDSSLQKVSHQQKLRVCGVS